MLQAEVAAAIEASGGKVDYVEVGSAETAFSVAEISVVNIQSREVWLRMIELEGNRWSPRSWMQ